MFLRSIFLSALLSFIASAAAGDLVDQSWQHAAPRAEIAPRFLFEPATGRAGGGALLIETDAREGLSGHWFKIVEIQGGKHYRFGAWRQTEGIPTPRRSAPARIVWQDAAGKAVPHDGPIVTSVLKGWKANAEPEFPSDRATDARGWTE